MWNTLFAIFTALVGSFLGSTFGAFLSGYYSERGKHTATHEDFENLLAEQRVTTSVAEQIKSAVSHDAWKAQMCWQERKTAYSEMLEYMEQVRVYSGEIVSQHVQQDYKKREKALNQIFALEAKLDRVALSIRIFGSQEAAQFLEKYLRRDLELHNYNGLEADALNARPDPIVSLASYTVLHAHEFRSKLIAIAKKDLGVSLESGRPDLAAIEDRDLEDGID
jgi:hypothetical protein